MNLVGQIINGLEIVGQPQRSGARGSNYKYPCQCVLCGKHKYLTLQSIRSRKTCGCGCVVDGLITKNGKSFAQWCHDNHRDDILELWDDELNIVTPQQISSQSQIKRWFKCGRGIHESFLYFLPNLARHTTHECFCAKCNSFAQHFIDRFGEEEFNCIWDYDNNTVDPWLLSYGSKQPVVAKCINDNTHKSYLTNAKSLMRGRRCPECARHLKVSSLQKLVKKYVVENYCCDIVYEYDCSLRCINPKTGYQLPYDNEITINNKHLIIEVHGEQHYKLNTWHKLNAAQRDITPEQVFQDQQWRDEYKKQYAVDNGYFYLAIPYWTEQDQSYQALIDEKFSEILSVNTTK